MRQITLEMLNTPSRWGVTAIDRFWKYVIKSNDCWIWVGCVNHLGYGKMFINHKVYIAHRCSWVIHNGDIDNTVCVLHKCDNRAFVNPTHLFLGTQIDNIMDCVSKGRNIKGEDCPEAKLTDTRVIEIRRLYQTGVRQADIARCFNVSQGVITSVVHRKSWNHI